MHRMYLCHYKVCLAHEVCLAICVSISEMHTELNSLWKAQVDIPIARVFQIYYTVTLK